MTAPRELDAATAERLWAELEEALAAHDAVLLDMEGCEFVDSAGLRAIIRAAQTLRTKEGRLGVVGLVEQPRRLFQMNGLDRSDELDLYADLDEARTALGIAGG